jgi:zinc protease
MITKVNLKTIGFLLSIIFTIQVVTAQEVISKFNKIKELGGIEEYMYQPNGMNVLLVQDNSAPVVTVQIVYRVGSKHEVSGNTGSTHLLEHLMFKGTPTFNKKNGNPIFKVLQNIGARMNATTWYDRTNYYETIPSDKIELALHIESDRMRNSLLLKKDKDAEMTVVRNEFERGENNPNSILNKEIWSAAYMAHTYHHSTIGWRSDIEKAPIETLRKFYNTYYWPNNATLTIIGDFQKDNLFKLIDKYFGKIEKAIHKMPQPYTEEPTQYGPRRVIIKKPGKMSVVSKAFKIPGRMHEDLPALKVLSQIIGSGPSSNLSVELVDNGHSLYTYARTTNFNEVGLFFVGTGFNSSIKHEDMELKIDSIIDNLKEVGILQLDVDRVVSKLNTQSILYRDGSGSVARQLNEAIAGGDWTDYINASKRLEKVTAEDVLHVAKKYLIEDQSTTGYFIPKSDGTNNKVTPKSTKMDQNNSKVFFRTPVNLEEGNITVNINESSLGYETIKSIENKNITRETIAGIDVVSIKTSAKDFVTVAASFPIGNYFNKNVNQMIPSITAKMLSKGTAKNDKQEFSKKLEKLGVSIRINADAHHIKISFKCLTKDADVVIGLLAEELREPLFDDKEFRNLKKQLIGNYQQSASNPKTKGTIALSQVMYPKGHPNYSTSIEEAIEYIENATIKDLKTFHKSYFGTKGMHCVVVGDVNAQELNKSLKTYFGGWSKGIVSGVEEVKVEKVSSKSMVISILKKPSAELFIGQYTGLKKSDDDYLAFYVANNILGGGFSGRLMQTVRDNDGLTYNISSRHSSDIFTGGYWYINASFNPSLFQKGLDATMIQVHKWAKDGVSQDEMNAVKSKLIGSFKVGMATTTGVALTILSFLERGLEPSYIDQYSKDIELVNLKQVNKSIKKYIDLDKLIIIKSGSLD